MTSKNVTQKNQKHKTVKAEDYVKTETEVPRDEFDDLERQDQNLDIAGWFSPNDEKPLPQIVKGVILQHMRRKNPRRNQSPSFFVIELAQPVIGLRFSENADAEGYEDTIEAGERVGIDMRQALEKLTDHRGPVKIAFVAKEEVEDRTWWRTEVYANLSKQPQQRPNGAQQDAADAKDLDKYL